MLHIEITLSLSLLDIRAPKSTRLGVNISKFCGVVRTPGANTRRHSCSYFHSEDLYNAARTGHKLLNCLKSAAPADMYAVASNNISEYITGNNGRVQISGVAVMSHSIQNPV
jgi:hypothetical protein